MERKKNLAQRLANGLDLPDEPIPGLSLVEITENRRVLVENHKGVIAYSPKTIRIRTKFGQILIDGTNLTLSKMTRGQLVICGCINGVSLLRGC